MIRETAIALSRYTSTPLPYWLEMTIDELYEWADAAAKVGGKKNV